MIGLASTARPTPIGRLSTAAMRIESSEILVASSFSFLTMAAVTAGTTEIVSGVMMAAGRLKMVCALP